jgi:DNA-binding NarL/FixJ family response regulator
MKLPSFSYFEKNLIKVLIVDDHPLIIDGLKAVLNDIHPCCEIFISENIDQAISYFLGSEPLTLVLIDPSFDDNQGLDLLKLVNKNENHPPIVIFSADDDIATARDALNAGAMGFISKRTKVEILNGALRIVLSGGIYIPPAMLFYLNKNNENLEQKTAPKINEFTGQYFGLTDRQLDVLTLLLQGKSNKAISNELAIAEGTTKTHIASILRTLNVKNRTQISAVINNFWLNMQSSNSSIPIENVIQLTSTKPKMNRLNTNSDLNTKVGQL